MHELDREHEFESAGEGEYVRSGEVVELRRLTRAAVRRFLEETDGGIEEKDFNALAYQFIVNERARTLAIHLIETGEEIGNCSLIASEHHEGRQMGIDIFECHQNNGYGTEAVRLLIAETRDARERIWLTVDSDNDRAKRVYEKCGFQYMGTRPYENRDGETRIEDVMEIRFS